MNEPTAAINTPRLGPLTAHQLQAALTRFGLGTFVEATPVTQGLFGQNVFIRSTEGEFVLRGSPHYPWQFPKERLGATLLHQQTTVPVAYPYLFEPTDDLFGWPYLLLPRLPGRTPADPTLSEAAQLAIAAAMGDNLVHLHQLTWPVAGAYDLATDTIQPFGEGFVAWIIADLQQWLAAARANGEATTVADGQWIEAVIDAARPALAHPFQPCFVMNDYNPGNVLVEPVGDGWRVSGLFDLMEYYFGDGEADLMRLIAGYLAQEQQGVRLAQAFATTYLAQQPPRPGFAQRYALYMLRDRLIVWEYGTRPGVQWFPPGQTFRDYAEPFTISWQRVVPELVPERL